MKINIDSVPYEIEKVDKFKYFMKKFPFNIEVPERYQNRKGGDYCGLNDFMVYQSSDGSLEIYTKESMDEELFLDEFSDAIRDNWDAMKEIEWEALRQVE